MRLADYMAIKGLTDDVLAPLIGVDRSTVCKLRNGQMRPSWDRAARIKAVTDGYVTGDDWLPDLPVEEHAPEVAE